MLVSQEYPKENSFLQYVRFSFCKIDAHAYKVNPLMHNIPKWADTL